MRSPVDQEDAAGHGGGRRTALKRVRYLGSARAGTEHFIQQRVTGVANLVLVIVLAVVAIALSGKGYAEAVAFVGQPWVAVPLALAIVSVCVHMRIGVQVIVEDYVTGDGARVLLLLLNRFFAVVVAAVALYSIVRIMLAALAAGDVNAGAL